MDRPIIINEFMQSDAVGYPIKMGAPNILPELPNGPVAACCLADEGVEMAFLGGKSVQTKKDWAEAWASDRGVEFAGSMVGTEGEEVAFGSSSVGLHEYVAHARS